MSRVEYRTLVIDRSKGDDHDEILNTWAKAGWRIKYQMPVLYNWEYAYLLEREID